MEIHRLGLLLCKKFLNRLADGILLIMFLIMIFPLFMLAVNSFMGKQELLETCGAVLADSGGHVRMGFCEVPFSWEENVVVIVYASDDSAFSGYDGFRISGFECG